MRIVVTGCFGFIGRRLIKELAPAAPDVRGVGPNFHPDQACSGVRYHLSDLADPATLLPAADAGEPFTLVHLGWDMRRGPEWTGQADCVARLARLLDYWAPRGLTRVVALGSAEEYGQRGGVLAEDDPPAGRCSPYGWAKRAAGELLRSWAEARAVPAVWLRPFVVYGPGQTGGMLVPHIVSRVSRGLPADLTDGLQERDFVYVDDVVRAVAAAAAAPTTGFACFNLGTGRPVRVRDVALEIGRLWDARPHLRFGAVPRRPGEPDTQAADPRLAENRLGWRAEVGWQDGLHRIRASGIPSPRRDPAAA